MLLTSDDEVRTSSPERTSVRARHRSSRTAGQGDKVGGEEGQRNTGHGTNQEVKASVKVFYGVQRSSRQSKAGRTSTNCFEEVH